MSGGRFSAEHRESQTMTAATSSAAHRKSLRSRLLARGIGGTGAAPCRAFGNPLQLARQVARRSATGRRDPSRGSAARRGRAPAARAAADAEIGGGSVDHDRGDHDCLALALERPLPGAPSRTAPRRTRRCPCARRPRFPSSCSGAMYWNVPRIVPFAVERLLAVGDRVSALDAGVAAERRSRFASPKSRSFAPDFVSMMLPGLRSRCTMPARCAVSSASAISIAVSQRLLERQRALRQALGERLAFEIAP